MEVLPKHSGTVESVSALIFASLCSRAGGGRRFDGVGNGCVLDIASIAGAPYRLSDYGRFIWTGGPCVSRLVTVRAGSPGGCFG